MGNFIADFYCPSEELVLELDGEDHFWEHGIEKDSIKENYLKSIGIRGLRFKNKWVFENITSVSEQIKAAFNHPRF